MPAFLATCSAAIGILFAAPLALPFNTAAAEPPPNNLTSGAKVPEVKGKLIKNGGVSEEAKELGATNESEAALASALKWLAEHQRPSGAWSFDHRNIKCRGRCKDHGMLKDATLGATGLALLPFMAAGNTLSKGQYKKNIQTGLRHLASTFDEHSGAMNEPGGNMYSHGIATLALCEACAKSDDEKLKAQAQAAIKFIEYAQDPLGGGWRYAPRTPGDMSVTGWQVQALHAAKAADLTVQDGSWERVTVFLDTVQSDEGAKYGYTRAGEACTAIGLLCRMYLGMKRDDPALVRGVKFLTEHGPSKYNMDWNLFATHVLFHYGGEEWTKWNDALQEQLVNSQEQEGHAKGSWQFRGHPGGYEVDTGGRHYDTCLAALILGIYYHTQPQYEVPRSE